MSMLLILNIFPCIVSIVMFYGRLVITHLKEIFSDIYAIDVFIVNVIMTLRYYNLLIVKLKIIKKDTIDGLLVEDISQEHVMSSSMFKHMLLKRIHTNGEGIPLDILIQLFVP